MQVNFVDLIKLVHPDHALESRYTSHERTILVLRHRNNPKKLESLAKTWGILAPKRPWKTKRRGIRIGDIVTFSCGKVGLVIDITDRNIGVVLDTTGRIRKFSDKGIKRYNVRFKAVCKNRDLWIATTLKSSRPQKARTPKFWTAPPEKGWTTR